MDPRGVDMWQRVTALLDALPVARAA